jgi:hypothetical protein
MEKNGSEQASEYIRLIFFQCKRPLLPIQITYKMKFSHTIFNDDGY